MDDDARPEQGPAGEVRRDRYVGGRDLTHWTTRIGRVVARLVEQLGRRLGPHAALLLTLAIGLALAAGLAAGGAEVYEAVTDEDGLANLDMPITAWFADWRPGWFGPAVTAYTDVAGVIGMPVLAIAVMLLLAIRRRSWTPVILMLSAGLGSLLMTIVAKGFIGRSRPPLELAVPPYEHSASFPSGHTLNATVIAGIVAYLIVLRLERRWQRVLTIAVAAVFAITIGLSRVVLGHHWLTDVVAAWALGAAWLVLVITAHRLYLTVRRASVEPDGEAVPAP